MKVTMVIPSYWARESDGGWHSGDTVYDHPTPLDGEGTLGRALESTMTLKDMDFQVVVIAVATAEDIERRVERKVADIIRSSSAAVGVPVSLFGHSHLNQINHILISERKKEYTELLKLRGYSNVRNMCLFVPHIVGSDVALLIDDDEVFEDPEFMSKVKEFIGKSIEGRAISAVAGYYLQPDGGYLVEKKTRPWMKVWGQYDMMNEAFEKVIGTEPRLKETPFVFGGNMIIHRSLFEVVPFDPEVLRGEDIDFLINARMFGYNFLLDNQLAIRHLPPQKTHAIWMQLRQDIYRFIYERAKIRNQKEVDGMTRVCPEDFDPYPGCFLKDDLDERIEKSCRILSEEYLSLGDNRSSEETLKNIALSKTDVVPKEDPFQHLCQIQGCWKGLMQYTSNREVRARIREVMGG